MPEGSLDELIADETSSVDDFIKELEAKEKDLHITADLTIEIAESDFDPHKIPAFVQEDISRPSPTGSSNASSPGLKTRVFELENEIDSLNERIRSLRGERNEIQEKSDRRLKDFENYKYRMDRERRGAFIDQIANLASQMLPVLDNLDRALDAANALPAEKQGELGQFFDGIVLVNQQVNEIFAGMGVQPIATVGETFDPNLHEAVSAEACDDLPANTISAEMLRGYRIGNKVIRHSMVKVTTQPQAAKTEAKADNHTAPETDPTAAGPADPLPDENTSSDLDASPAEAE